MGEQRTGAEVVWKQPIDCGPAPSDGETFDAIVVGGGPGGSAAAGYLAMEGKRVLLIEKETWPRDKICGDAVGGKSLSHVKELGVKETLEATPHFRVTGIEWRYLKKTFNASKQATPCRASNLTICCSIKFNSWFETLAAPFFKAVMCERFSTTTEGAVSTRGKEAEVNATPRVLSSESVDETARNSPTTPRTSSARRATAVRWQNPCLRKPTRSR